MQMEKKGVYVEQNILNGLIIEGKNCHLEKRDAVLFSAMALHWVEGVWEGTRYAVAVWSGDWGFNEISKEEEKRQSALQDKL